MGFLDLFKKLKQQPSEQKENVKNVNCYGEPLDKLDKDGELPWGWVYANRDFTEQIQEEYKYFLNTQIESMRTNDIKNEYSATKSLILYIQDAKKLCAKKGECFVKWFNDCIADDKFLSRKIERLEYLEKLIGR